MGRTFSATLSALIARATLHTCPSMRPKPGQVRYRRTGVASVTERSWFAMTVQRMSVALNPRFGSRVILVRHIPRSSCVLEQNGEFRLQRMCRVHCLLCCRLEIATSPRFNA